MFLLLNSLVLCADSPRMEIAAPVDASETGRTLYEIKYNSGTKKYATSQGGQGYYVGVRVYNDQDQPGEIHLLNYYNQYINGAPLPVDGLEFSFYTEYGSFAGDTLIIKFRVFNTLSTRPKKFDLGIFCDAMLNQDDDASIQFTSDRRGIFISTNKQVTFNYTNLLKGHYFPDVSTVFIGENKDTYNKNDPSTLPFWTETDLIGPITGKNSVFAFSWRKVEVQPWAELFVGYLARAGESVPLPPFIKLNYEKKEQYPKNTDIPIGISITDKDLGDQITYKMGLNGTVETQTIQAEYAAFRQVINLKDSLRYDFWIQAVDRDGHKSENISITFMAEGANIPNFTVNKNKLKPVYNPGEKIELLGTTDDENAVTIKYRFNNGFNFTGIKVDTRDDGVQHFHDEIALGGKSLELGQDYTLYVWAVDTLGQTSEVVEHKFFYNNPPQPTIISAHFSRQRVMANQTIIIFGSATDPNVSQTIKVFASVNDNKTEIGEIPATNTEVPFAFYYTIPEVHTGYFNISVSAEDSENMASTVSYNREILVYDPTQPDPPERLGNITVIPVTKNTNACFNLQYTSSAGENYQMSFNDEGFYAGYRLSNERTPGKTKLIKQGDSGEAEPDMNNVTAVFDHSYDPVTGYLILQFNVTNKNYFGQKVDLGLFVDSKFAGNDDSPIRIRNDMRGFTVTDTNPDVVTPKVKYTVFTREFGDMIDVDTYNFLPVERTNTNEIPVDKIPFFEDYAAPPSEGNSMYAFAWRNKEIPANETVVFKVYMAPSDNVRTPSTLTDWTELPEGKNFLFPGDKQTITLQVTDFDVGETIQLVYKINDQPEFVKNVTITANQKSQIVEHEIKIPFKKYLTYKVYARDTSLSYVSNTIERTIPLSPPPNLYPNDIYPSRVLTPGIIKLTGNVEGEEGETTFIKYQIGNGMIEIAKTIVHSTEDTYIPYDVDINISKFVKPGHYTFKFWATDNYGSKESEIKSFEFDYVEAHPPRLLRAGLASQTAKAGDKLVAYVLVDDPDANEQMKIQVMEGKNVKWDNNKFIFAQNKKQDKAVKPYAFYYYVPRLAPGVYEINFRVIDTDGLPSNVISRTLIIT